MQLQIFHLYHHMPDPLPRELLSEHIWLCNNALAYSLVALIKAQNQEDVERLRKELAVADGDEQEEDDEIDDQNLGRAIFGPKSRDEKVFAKKSKRPELEEGDGSDEDEQREDGQQDDVEIVTERSGTKQPKGILKKTNGAIRMDESSMVLFWKLWTKHCFSRLYPYQSQSA